MNKSGVGLSKKMLIVDDDPPILAFLAEIGKFCGYEVESRDTGHNLVDRVIESQPDFIILDIVMPKFDGIEVLREMAEKKIEARLLLISGFDPELLQRARMLARAWQLNVVDIMEKPLDKDEVIACLAAGELEPQIQTKWKTEPKGS
jgi:two-component system, OmpR family, alkaline phosphatase synthesis response regulator PhoP